MTDELCGWCRPDTPAERAVTGVCGNGHTKTLWLCRRHWQVAFMLPRYCLACPTAATPGARVHLTLDEQEGTT